MRSVTLRKQQETTTLEFDNRKNLTTYYYCHAGCSEKTNIQGFCQEKRPAQATSPLILPVYSGRLAAVVLEVRLHSTADVDAVDVDETSWI